MKKKWFILVVAAAAVFCSCPDSFQAAGKKSDVYLPKKISITESIKGSGTNMKEEWKFTYDSAGRLKTEKYDTTQFQNEEKDYLYHCTRTYTYDKNDRGTKMVELSWNGEKKTGTEVYNRTITYSYDGASRISGLKESFKVGKVRSNGRIYYNPKENQNNAVTSFTIEYKNGGKTVTWTKPENPKTPYYTYKLKFNKKGQITKMDYKVGEESRYENWYNKGVYNRTFDSDGLIIKEKYSWERGNDGKETGKGSRNTTRKYTRDSKTKAITKIKATDVYANGDPDYISDAKVTNIKMSLSDTAKTKAELQTKIILNRLSLLDDAVVQYYYK